jgi:hypothetical protein
MAFLSTLTGLALVDLRDTSGVVLLPTASTIPGRVITFKDQFGVASSNSSLTIRTQGADYLENGATSITLQNPYAFLTLAAGKPNKWYTVGGNVLPSLQVSTLTITSSLTLTPGLTIQRFPKSTGPFSPSTFPGLIGWYDANTPFNTETALSTNVQIDAWQDKSGYNFPLSSFQSTATLRLTTNSFGKGSAVLFQESIYSTIITPEPTTDEFSYFGLHVFNNASNQSIFNIGYLGASHNYSTLTVFHNPDMVSDIALSTTVQPLEACLFNFRINQYYTHSFRVNGSTIIAPVVGSGPATNYSTIFVGDFNSYSQNAEILFYSTFINLPSTQTMEGYLAWKHGVQNILPPEHPYRYTQP